MTRRKQTYVTIRGRRWRYEEVTQHALNRFHGVRRGQRDYNKLIGGCDYEQRRILVLKTLGAHEKMATQLHEFGHAYYPDHHEGATIQFEQECTAFLLATNKHLAEADE